MSESWAVVLTRNNLHLSKNAIASLRMQVGLTAPLRILVVDNDSSDGTSSWIATQPDLFTIMNRPQLGVAAAWNQALKWIFYSRGMPCALVINNDAILRPDSYHYLLADGGGFVTCVGSDDPKSIEGAVPPDPEKKRPHPDFSCYLIRRWVYEKVGPFDERYVGAFAEDADYHLRMQRAGVRAEALELSFYHYGSATVKMADEKERRRIQIQADKNRALFKETYGFSLGTDEYYRQFGHTAPDS